MGLLESLIAQRQGLKIKLFFPPIPLRTPVCASVRAYACVRARVCLRTYLKLVRSWKMFPTYVKANGKQQRTYLAAEFVPFFGHSQTTWTT